MTKNSNSLVIFIQFGYNINS